MLRFFACQSTAFHFYKNFLVTFLISLFSVRTTVVPLDIQLLEPGRFIDIVAALALLLNVQRLGGCFGVKNIPGQPLTKILRALLYVASMKL